MPSEVKWIKIVTDIFDDEKILLIESMPQGDSIIVIWFKLLCLAGKQNNEGVFMLNDRIAYTDEMLASIFRRPINIVRLALDTFLQFGMVEIINNAITIPKWELYQKLEGMERVREQNRLRVQKHREKQKNLAVTLQSRDVTQSDIDSDIEKEKERESAALQPQKRTRFTPPTVDEVAEYCRERNNNVNPETFVDFYSSKGWKVGNQPMKDWKAAVRTWEKRNNSNQGKVRSTSTMPDGSYEKDGVTYDRHGDALI